MKNVDIQNFEFALSEIEDGYIFEEFACNFLADILGYKFEPAGGLKDRGIDGLEHIFNRKNYDSYIYQMTIQENCKAKIKNTLEKLKKNKIKIEKFYYCTNKICKNKDKLTEEFFEKYKKPLHIFDLKWFSSRVNNSSGTKNAYYTFIDNHLYKFKTPGESYVIDDLVSDPRLFVFLRQQWDYNYSNLRLDQILADTLILYCLEGTDPDEEKVKTKEQIKKDIAKYINFDPSLIFSIIDERLELLSQKPRKIKYHTKYKGYVLPYDTRQEIQERNIKDVVLYKTFRRQSESKLKRYLKNNTIKVKDCVSLIDKTINKIFYRQGIEFSDFVLKGENPEAFEKDLFETIDLIVEDSSVIPKNREEVKNALMITIRDIVYNGTEAQKLFLAKLSNTYMMFFLLQIDPKLCTFFDSLASQLKVYVCTSIIIPALSEFFLEDVNKRHWNLLKKASEAGVTLIINEIILEELIFHFKKIITKYEDFYKENEDIYLEDEMQTLYIDEIMIRAYFYAKTRKKVKTFNDFINKFISPNLKNVHTDLIELLKELFGIQYKSDSSLGISIKDKEENLLYEKLKNQKTHDIKARIDSRLILTIYSIRDKNNEIGTSGIFGYNTWWLSTDTVTYRTVNQVFKNKYNVSCYMRPDFLYNFISLTPRKGEIDSVYHDLFPSLLGVNISYNLPDDVIECIHQYIKEHKNTPRARVKATLRTLIDELKTNRNHQTRRYTKHYLDEKLNKYIRKKQM